MSLQLAPDHWLKPVQRWFGVGLMVNAMAVHSKMTHLSASVIETWYDDSIAWMREWGQVSPNLAFVGVKGFEDADTYAFASADKRFRRRGFADVPSINIFSKDPIGLSIGSCSLSPRFSVSLSNSQMQGIASVCIWAWEDMGAEMTKNIFLKQCHWAHSAGILDYALVLQQSSRMLPEVEAMHDPFSRRLIVRSHSVTGGGYPTKHIFESGGHTINYLREIYPYQLLSAVHLSHRMQDKSLKEWIESSPNHGVLAPFSEKHWVWEIPTRDIQAIREALNASNLLTLYLPDMNRIYEDYGKSSEK
jgi:hypothetical protein